MMWRAQNMKPGKANMGKSLRHPVKPAVFVSHCVDDKKFVFEVCDLLSPYLSRESMFLFEKRPTLDEHFLSTIDKELTQSDIILIFVGKRFDEYMQYEAKRGSV